MNDAGCSPARAPLRSESDGRHTQAVRRGRRRTTGPAPSGDDHRSSRRFPSRHIPRIERPGALAVGSPRECLDEAGGQRTSAPSAYASLPGLYRLRSRWMPCSNGGAFLAKARKKAMPEWAHCGSSAAANRIAGSEALTTGAPTAWARPNRCSMSPRPKRRRRAGKNRLP